VERSLSTRTVPVLVALVGLAAVPAAGARLVGQFDAGLRNIKANGSYTIVASGRVYETSGEPAPQLASAAIHFPRGAALRRQFLVPRFFCDASKLQRDPDPALCRRAHFAGGTMLVDARPVIQDPFSVDVDLFLARGEKRGATAGVVVLVKSNQKTPVYDYQVLGGNLFRETAGGGRFGYRLELPTTLAPLLPTVRLSLAEFQIRMRGLTLTKRVKRCVRRSRVRPSRCLQRRVGSRSVFWIRPPRCPRRAKVSFGVDYAFEGASQISKRRRVSCGRFLRQRTLHHRGRIPGAARAG
jgi:hypothetical protein